MRNLIREGYVSFRNPYMTPAVLLLQLLILIMFPNVTGAQNPKVLLEQSANGPADEPLSPPRWIKGHVGRTNSHYAPGSVIPYRAIVTNLPIGCPLRIRFTFLADKNGKHATDFPTNYNQSTLEHINEFGNWEPVDPLAGLTGNFTGPTTFDFPLADNLLLPGDQSTTQSNNLYFLSKYGPQRMSAWNADLSDLPFVGYGDRIPNDGGTRQLIFDVIFTATSSQVVFAWGGHIAYDTLDFNLGWGYFDGLTLGSGSSSAAGLTECLPVTLAAASSGGADESFAISVGGQSFTGGTGEITYSISGGKPINPTSPNRSDIQGEQIVERQKSSVFPNPNNGSATVMLPHNAESFDITLSDISGKIIKSWSEYKNQRLELTALRPGMYFLNIITQDLKNKSILKVVVLN